MLDIIKKKYIITKCIIARSILKDINKRASAPDELS